MEESPSNLPPEIVELCESLGIDPSQVIPVNLSQIAHGMNANPKVTPTELAIRAITYHGMQIIGSLLAIVETIDIGRRYRAGEITDDNIAEHQLKSTEVVMAKSEKAAQFLDSELKRIATENTDPKTDRVHTPTVASYYADSVGNLILEIARNMERKPVGSDPGPAA